ncbi:MAG: NAD(P)H-hydrate dehydratase [Clostridia bacterium]|nr:NAD(P)H-hydrate dehydratase [Clostridia bacterium]
MKKVISVETMRNSDAAKISSGASGIELMYNAGKAAFEHIDCESKKIAIVCGTGNNAGDGYVIALLAEEKGADVTIFLIKEKFSSDGKFYFDKCIKKGIKYTLCDDNTCFSQYDVIVDCIFGTGFKDIPSGITADIIKKINISQEKGTRVVSIDINSGLNGDNGLSELCVCSDLTISIGTLKSGHFLGDAKDKIGQIVNCDIDIPISGEYFRLLEDNDFYDIIKERKNNSHKGTYGIAGVLGGCKEYSGAIKLANMSVSQLRSGCGISRVIIADSLFTSVSPYLLESTLFLLKDIDGKIIFDENEINNAIKGLNSLAIGMGWGVCEENRKILEYIIKNFQGNLIIDADGLNILSALDMKILKSAKCKIAITPHPKEFSRLSKIPVSEILCDPIRYSREFASEYNIVVLLKGTSTIITDGDVVSICSHGCSGMASAGSGDVLSGIAAGLAAYNDDMFHTMECASYINGIAGELAQAKLNSISMIAHDTVDQISNAVNKLLQND